MDTDEILERATWDFFWVPPGVRIIDRPELLYLCSPRPSTTLNMVARIRPRNPDHAAELVGEVAAAHAGRPSRFQLTVRSDTPLLRPVLESAGYALAHEHCSMALAVEDFTPRPSTGIEVRRVVDLAGLKDNIAVGEAAFGKTSVFTAAELAQQVRECTAEGFRVHRFVAYDAATGAALSAANFNAFHGLGFGFFGSQPEAEPQE